MDVVVVVAVAVAVVFVVADVTVQSKGGIIFPINFLIVSTSYRKLHSLIKIEYMKKLQCINNQLKCGCH